MQGDFPRHYKNDVRQIESGSLAAARKVAAPALPPLPMSPPPRDRLYDWPQSSMSRHIPQFCGVLGHTFMEFLKGSGDYCQAQHDLYADK